MGPPGTPFRSGSSWYLVCGSSSSVSSLPLPKRRDVDLPGSYETDEERVETGMRGEGERDDRGGYRRRHRECRYGGWDTCEPWVQSVSVSECVWRGWDYASNELKTSKSSHTSYRPSSRTRSSRTSSILGTSWSTPYQSTYQDPSTTCQSFRGPVCHSREGLRSVRIRGTWVGTAVPTNEGGSGLIQ